VNGEQRTSLVVLAIAVLCLMAASAFAPQIGAQAKAVAEPPFVIEDVPAWLFRLVAWAPEPVAEHAACAEAAPTPSFWEFL
jgi:hypothetical protein